MGLSPHRYQHNIRKIATFWWPENNFGDLLGPFLLRSLGLPCFRVDTSAAELVFVGSILEMIPDSFSGYIAGAGFIKDGASKQLPGAKILAVRGRLTAARIAGAETATLGDPLLLAPLLARHMPAPNCDVCLVPHFTEVAAPRIRELAKILDGNCVVAQTAGPPLGTLAKIIASRFVISSSLHGLVVADAFGIPSVWLPPPETLVGGDYKFRDYLSGVGYLRDSSPENMLRSMRDVRRLAMVAPRNRIVAAQQRLLRVMEFIAASRGLTP